MVTGPVQQSSVVARPFAGPPHPASLPDERQCAAPPGDPHPAGLAGDLHALARAVAAAPTEARWRERVLLRLRPVGQSFTEHVQVTEGPAGLYRELLTHAPRLYHGVRLLTREHTAIGGALLAVQRVAEQSEASPDELRHRAAYLLRTLARHRRRGADLLWQAYQMDLGGET
ncbi:MULTISPECIES: hypothetical protein [unclassified Micromonospora]|uniref:hypothetical protein n=1 Tax=unclassified Micromonospora TaxID=2617518 RepID=UPI001F359412|nr:MULTISPECIES: hypothetical protein [unclassified Micromonospora]